MICQTSSHSGGGGGGGGTSVWGYLTAGVVAANVVANLVANANENNNNNNNNDNQDNTNNNNMNIGNSANSNMNMNILIPVPGGRRSLESHESVNTTNITSFSRLTESLLCLLFSDESDKE